MSYLGRVEQKSSDVRRFNVTGSTSATHTLTWVAPSEQSLIVTINGVKQQNNYTVSGVTLTLDTPLTAPDAMEVVGILDIGETNIPADDSITNAMVKSDAAIALSKLATDPSNASNLASGTVPTARLGSGSASSSTILYGDNTWAAPPAEYNDAGLQDDIALLGFRVASNGSLAKYNLVDQTVDDFQDTSGVDASASTNEVRDSSGKYYSGQVAGQAEVEFDYTGSVQSYTVPAGKSSLIFKAWGAGGGNGGYDGAGGGYATGTIAVTAGDVLKIVVGGGGTPGGGSEGAGGGGMSGVFYPTELDTGNPTYARLIAGGGGGGGRASGFPGGGGGTDGNDGAGDAGEGGSQSAGGAIGGSFSGTTAGSQFQGGTGGNGSATGGYGGGGPGSTGGAGPGGGGGGWYGGGGGGSAAGGGGGSAYYNASYVTSATLTAAPGGDSSTSVEPANTGDSDYDPGTGAGATSAGAGEHGYVIIPTEADVYNNMTLVSTTTAAQAAPTKGDIVLTYTNGAGTTTLDTDLTAEISADGGSTWTALALASEGSTGSHNIATSHDVTISSTITAPYNMAYRIKTLNQSVSKTTRIQAVSLGWS